MKKKILRCPKNNTFFPDKQTCPTCMSSLSPSSWHEIIEIPENTVLALNYQLNTVLSSNKPPSKRKKKIRTIDDSWGY